MGRLQQQWDAHREPLNEQLSRLTQEMEDKKVSVTDALLKNSDLSLEYSNNRCHNACKAEFLLYFLTGIYQKHVLLRLRWNHQDDYVQRNLSRPRTSIS